MTCPKCQKSTNTFKEGDGYFCLTCGSFGDDRLAAWERLVDDLTPAEMARYREAARVGEQLQFADVGVE